MGTVTRQVRFRVFTYLRMYGCVRICVCMHGCVSVNVRVCASVCIRLYQYVCLCASVSVRVFAIGCTYILRTSFVLFW